MLGRARRSTKQPPFNYYRLPSSFDVLFLDNCTADCTLTLTLDDDELPVAMCQDITVELDENGMVNIDPNDINNNSTDNCGIDTMFLSPNVFDCSFANRDHCVLY